MGELNNNNNRRRRGGGCDKRKGKVLRSLRGADSCLRLFSSTRISRCPARGGLGGAEPTFTDAIVQVCKAHAHARTVIWRNIPCVASRNVLKITRLRTSFFFFFFRGVRAAQKSADGGGLRWELTLCRRRRGPAAAGCVRLSWRRRGSCGSPPWRRAKTGATLPSQAHYVRHARSRCPDTHSIGSQLLCGFCPAEEGGGRKKSSPSSFGIFFLRGGLVPMFFGSSPVFCRSPLI